MRVRTAVVTGANRGLGLETTRQLAQLGFRVVLTGRDLEKAERAAGTLRGQGLEVLAHQLDVTSDESCARLGVLGTVDVLVNNAAVLVESDENPLTAGLLSRSALDVAPHMLREAFDTNTLGAYRVIQALVPGMRAQGYGRIVNVSSGLGQLEDMGGGYPAYRVSKAALNALTRIFAAELRSDGILVNAVCPGWVRTDMGGSQASLTPNEGAETIVWAATLPDGGPTATFFRNKEPIPW